MALITCPECGSSISSTARACPKCGHENINSLSSKIDIKIDGNNKKNSDDPLNSIFKFFGFILIVVGILISMTGLGALVGIPLVVIGSVSFFFPGLSFLLTLIFILHQCNAEKPKQNNINLEPTKISEDKTLPETNGLDDNDSYAQMILGGMKEKKQQPTSNNIFYGKKGYKFNNCPAEIITKNAFEKYYIFNKEGDKGVVIWGNHRTAELITMFVDFNLKNDSTDGYESAQNINYNVENTCILSNSTKITYYESFSSCVNKNGYISCE